MPSFKTPTKQQIEAAIQRMRSPEFAAYFLSRLDNPKWIPALEENGLLANPLPAISVEGGGTRYPHWPPSRYLARMAAEAPREVADIFAKIETDNASILGDMLDAALAMPANVSVSLVPRICRAARAGALWIHFKDASDLCVRLAEGAEFGAAMQLAEALFTPKVEEGQRARRCQDLYWYKDGLKKVVPILAGSHAHDFLPDVCDWLKTVVEAREHFDPKSADDGSCWWRPAIEEHEQNQDYEFAGVMAGFTRKAFEHALQSGGIVLDEALQIVERYSYLVFKRLRIHLTNEFADQSPDLARQIILDHGLFDDYRFKHEYAMLVGKRLYLLSWQEREEWFSWIDAGAGLSDFDELFKVSHGRDPTDEERRTSVRWWKFEKLHWVRAYLDGERQVFYASMLAEHGEPDMADLNVRMGPVRWGSDSPMTVDELREKTFEQAVDEVSSWKPQGSRFSGPSMDGLASTFAQYLATDPEQFSMKARVLVDRPSVFVRRFISQMTDAIKGGRQIDLRPVLELCNWVVSRPADERTTPEQEDEVLVDENWQWTRDDISRLLENGCKAKSGAVPKYAMEEFRQPIWAVIKNLLHDPAESYTEHDVSHDDPRTRDYLNVGINSSRGKAVGAALEYARWVANHIKQSDGKQEIVPDGFGAMPEVREMLEWQIDPNNRTVAAMAVIGSFTGLICWIDKQWLADNAHRLFELEELSKTPTAVHEWAAWNAFLTWVRPHIEYYRVLKAQFAYAVEQAAKVTLGERSRDQPMYHLGEHLMLLYGRGHLSLNDDDGLLMRFVETSSPDIRRHAMGFIGETLEGDEEVPNEVIQRFMCLWDSYWGGSGRKDAAEEPNAFLFGLWFSCGRFPEQWALDRLAEYVKVVPTPEPDHAVAEKLAEIAHVDTLTSVRVLDRMVRGDQEGWRIHGWLDPAKEILKQAMKTPGQARDLAMSLIDYLGRRGHTDFGQLLKE